MPEEARKNKRFINHRPLLFTAVGLALGVALCGIGGGLDELSGVSTSTIAAIVVASAVSLALLALSLIRRSTGLTIFAAAVLVGILRTYLATPTPVVNGQYELTGVVVKVEDNCALKLSDAELDGKSLDYDVRLRAGNVDVQVGDVIRAHCNAWTPQNTGKGYNVRRAMLASGISVMAEADSVEVVAHDGAPVHKKLDSIRNGVNQTIHSAFGSSAPAMSAFLLGDRSELTDDYNALMRDSGVAHLLALSGYNVGLLTGIILLLIPKRRPVARFVVSALFLAAYCAIAAFEASLVRASIMCVCMLAAQLFNRRPDPLSSISLAAVILLLSNPYSLYSLGAQLSFAATLGILFMGVGRLRLKFKTIEYIVNALLLSVAGTVATMLITAHSFGQLPLYTLLSNIVAVPIFTLAIVTGAIITALAFILPTGLITIAGSAVGSLLELSNGMLARIASLPNAVLEVRKPPMLACVIALGMLFMMSCFVLRPLKQRLMYTSALFIVFTAVMIADIITI